jgi:hypothetical protein
MQTFLRSMVAVTAHVYSASELQSTWLGGLET